MKKSKAPHNSVKHTIKSSTPSEDRPDLDGYLSPKSMKLYPEKFAEKKSLPEHLYNPYIYIKKVISKGKNKNYRFDHPDTWNFSCNYFSKRRIYNERPDDADVLNKSLTATKLGESKASLSASKKLTQEERVQAYSENANLREFTSTFFKRMYDFFNSKRKRDAQDTAEGQAQAEDDVAKHFEAYCKKKNISFVDSATEGGKKPIVDEDKYVEFPVFLDFLYTMGFTPSDQEEIRRLFDHFAETHIQVVSTGSPEKSLVRSSILTKRQPPQQISVEKISMRAFFYNYKKFVKERYKVRYILSEKMVKQRNADIKIYIKEFYSNYEAMKSDIIRSREEEEKMKAVIDSYGRNHSGNLIQRFQEVSEFKNQLWRDKKLLLKFINQEYQKSPFVILELDPLVQLNEENQKIQTEELTLIGKFIRDFRQHKFMFKENAFDLFELANFIHEKKLPIEDFEVLSDYIIKMKKYYNITQGRDKHAYVEPKEPLENIILSASFERMCKKAETEVKTIAEFLESLEKIIDQHEISGVKSERVAKTMHQNIVADFILKFFESLDHALIGKLSKLEEISHFLNSDETSTMAPELVVNKLLQIFDGVKSDPNEEKSLLRDQPEFESRIWGSPQRQPLGQSTRTEAQKDDDIDQFIEFFNEKKKPTGKSESLRGDAKKGLSQAGAKEDKDSSNQQRMRVQDLQHQYDQLQNQMSQMRTQEQQSAVSTQGRQQQRPTSSQQQQKQLPATPQPKTKFGQRPQSAKTPQPQKVTNQMQVLQNQQLLRQKEHQPQVQNFMQESQDLTQQVVKNEAQSQESSPQLQQPSPQSNQSSIQGIDPNKLSQLLEVLKNPQIAELLTNPQLLESLKNLQQLQQQQPPQSKTSNPLITTTTSVQSRPFNEFSANPAQTLASNRTNLNAFSLDRDITLTESQVTTKTFPGQVPQLKGFENIEKSKLDTSQKLAFSPRSSTGRNHPGLKASTTATINKILEMKDPELLTKSTLKEKIDESTYVPESVALGKSKPQVGRFSNYETILPSSYYSYLAKQNVEMTDSKWYLRPHHIETLTENPKSIKDNLLGAEYITYYSEAPKSKPGKDIVGYNQKESLIASLEEQREKLKGELELQQKLRSVRTPKGITRSKAVQEVAKYYDTVIREKPQGPELLVTGYEGILDELRTQERELINKKREEEFSRLKPPTTKWWELKTPEFIDEYRKHVFMVNADPVDYEAYMKYVEDLKSTELA